MGSEYDQLTKENEITKATKDQDVKYKTKESKGLDKAVSETNADRATVQTELDAVNEYYSGIKARCIAKAETYAKDGAAHGAAEGIIGLLEVCESDFSKGLAEMTAAEESAASEYEQPTKANEISKATKTQDVKYKTKEAKSLDKDTAEEGADK